MKRRAQLLVLLVSAVSLLACEDDAKTVRRRGPQSGAVSPSSDGGPNPNGTPSPGTSWDGLSDRSDAVWSF